MLGFFARSGDLKAVEALLTYTDVYNGKDLYIQASRSGSTVLHHAIESGNLSVLKAILSHLQKLTTLTHDEKLQLLTTTNNMGMTPLDVALVKGKNGHLLEKCRAILKAAGITTS